MATDCLVENGVCARHTANNPTCVTYEGTSDQNRTLSLPEVDALITIEAVERLMVKVHRLLTPEHGDEGVDENTRLEAQCLLESAIDLTTTRTCTAVKRQSISDAISHAARVKVQIVTADVDARMRPLRGEDRG